MNLNMIILLMRKIVIETMKLWRPQCMLETSRGGRKNVGGSVIWSKTSISGRISSPSSLRRMVRSRFGPIYQAYEKIPVTSLDFLLKFNFDGTCG